MCWVEMGMGDRNARWTSEIRVWVETQKPAWTGFRRTNGGNRVFMKKWNLIWKNKYFRMFLTKTWHGEDPYGILFHIVVCPEGPWGIDFLKRVRKIGIPKIQETSRILYFGSKTKIFGLWDHSNGQKSAPNKIRRAPGPRNPLKIICLYIFGIYYIII